MVSETLREAGKFLSFQGPVLKMNNTDVISISLTLPQSVGESYCTNSGETQKIHFSQGHHNHKSYDNKEGSTLAHYILFLCQPFLGPVRKVKFARVFEKPNLVRLEEKELVKE